MVSRRHDLSVISDRLVVSESHSQRTETVQRQSKPNKYPSEVSEGKYLASAAAYVRAHISRCSPYHDETVCHASKGPLDKLDTESATISVRKETDLTSSRAIELSISCPKPESVNIEECVEDDPHFSELPNEAEMQLRDLHAVSNGETSADLHSPGHCVVLSPVHTSAPADPEQAYSIHQLD